MPGHVRGVRSRGGISGGLVVENLGFMVTTRFLVDISDTVLGVIRIGGTIR